MGGDEAVGVRSTGAQADSWARRTSFSLTDKALLRATAPAVLLGGIGRRMRGSAGGIGGVAESGDDAYARSYPVEELDIFLSHSWHTWWLLKYLTLLYYFNAVPASLAGTFAGLGYMLWRFSTDGGAYGVKPYAQVIGSSAFITTILSWHHVLARIHVAEKMFLDKVCIHQTDSDLKIKGIKSIGAILANSRLMLVTWDSTYFERLWCTYEMSAFRKGNPNGRIKVLPVILGLFALCYCLATAVADLVLAGVEVSLTDRWVLNDELYYVSALLHLPMFILVMRVMARYINNLKKLKMQLANFSIRSAKCFCCDAKHVHPATGAHLPCDREVVNNSIENWMGLDTFDRMVRGDFKRYVKRTLGGRAKLPYRYAVAASMWPGLALADHFVADGTRHWFVAVVCCLEATYLRHPLIIALTTAFLSRYQNSMQAVFERTASYVTRRERMETVAKWMLYTSAGMQLSVMYYIVLIANSRAMQYGMFSFAIWIFFQICCISSLYFGGIICGGRSHMAMWSPEDAGPLRITGRESMDGVEADASRTSRFGVEMSRVSGGSTGA